MNILRRLKKPLIILTLTVAASYAVMSLLLAPLSRFTLKFLSDQAYIRGVEVHKAGFKSVYFNRYDALTWRDIEIHFQVIKKDDVFVEGREFIFKVGRLSVKIKNLTHRKFGIHLEDLNLSSIEGGETIDHLTGQDLYMKIFFDFMDFKNIPRQIESWIKGMEDVAKTGRTLWPIEFAGAVYVNLHGESFKIRISVTEDDFHQYGLVMNKDDLSTLAGKAKDRLTPPEIDLISRNPLRAPEVLRISSYAGKAAEAAGKKEKRINENCYRHVIWSYLLTKKFGPEFAKQVADAHEAGRLDPEGDRGMDMRNNSVGRRYGVKGYSEESILGRLLKDPNAVLNGEHWKEIQAREKALPPQKTVSPGPA